MKRFDAMVFPHGGWTSGGVLRPLVRALPEAGARLERVGEEGAVATGAGFD